MKIIDDDSDRDISPDRTEEIADLVRAQLAAQIDMIQVMERHRPAIAAAAARVTGAPDTSARTKDMAFRAYASLFLNTYWDFVAANLMAGTAQCETAELVTALLTEALENMVETRAKLSEARGACTPAPRESLL